MKVGLLWYDDDPARSLQEKVKRAASAYKRKHGVRPNRCCVHPAMLDGNITVSGVDVVPLGTVLRHHLWVGVSE